MTDAGDMPAVAITCMAGTECMAGITDADNPCKVSFEAPMAGATGSQTVVDVSP